MPCQINLLVTSSYKHPHHLAPFALAGGAGGGGQLVNHPAEIAGMGACTLHLPRPLPNEASSQLWGPLTA